MSAVGSAWRRPFVEAIDLHRRQLHVIEAADFVCDFGKAGCCACNLVAERLDACLLKLRKSAFANE